MEGLVVRLGPLQQLWGVIAEARKRVVSHGLFPDSLIPLTLAFGADFGLRSRQASPLCRPVLSGCCSGPGCRTQVSCSSQDTVGGGDATRLMHPCRVGPGTESTPLTLTGVRCDKIGSWGLDAGLVLYAGQKKKKTWDRINQ